MPFSEDLGGRVTTRVSINSAAGSITLAAAVAGTKLRVTFLSLSVDGAGDVAFLGDAVELWRINFSAAGRETLPLNEDGWAETAEFQALKISNPSTVTIKGVVGYVKI